MSESQLSSNCSSSAVALDIEQAVRNRYSMASKKAEPSLCCPVDYDEKLLKALPAEIIERDYGCGDPSKYVREGETVLDLGSGVGKVCFIASQVVGAHGRVIGVDMNAQMLDLARKYTQSIGDRIGYHNVQFFKGRIQDLSLDLERFDAYLSEKSVHDAGDWARAQAHADRLRREKPMIASDSIDVVVSNCVLNLVRPDSRNKLFEEMFRVLRRGGRAVISDIVSDEDVPDELKNDSALWSGCISGAFVETDFIKAFVDAGFYGVEVVDRPVAPWAVVEGIEFRSVTIQAFKGKEGPCEDYNQAVIYRGPWRTVTDDDGHTLSRGAPMAVCGKTFSIYTREPYARDIISVPPSKLIARDDARPFDCRQNAVREARETKRGLARLTVLPDPEACCGGGTCS